MPKTSARSAFTLVELLVVITIIVVLLAMLAPAMERTIYQAELAICGSQQKGIGTGVLAYALNNKRMYPYRPHERGSDQPVVLKQAGTGVHDDRTFLKPYMPLKILLCPLAAKISIELEDTLPNSIVCTNTPLTFGFQYKGERGMFRVGDRFTGVDIFGRRHAFNILSSDIDTVAPNATNVVSSTHQDDLRIMGPRVFQDNTITCSWWANLNAAATGYRGLIDKNVGFDDGSVRRYNRLAWNINDRSNQDMAEVPLAGSNTLDNYRNHLPR